MPEDPDLELSHPLQHHISQQSVIFPALLIMYETSETVSQPQLSVFFYKGAMGVVIMSLLSNRTLTKATCQVIFEKLRGLFIFFLFCIFVFQDKISLCSLSCPGPCSVDQAGLHLTEVCLPLPPNCKYWD